MKNFTKSALFFLFLCLLAGTQIFAQTRVNQNLSGFTSIKASSGVDVYLRQGDSESVEVEVEDEDDLEYVVTEVKDNTLIIKTSNKTGWFTNIGTVKVYVNFRKLDQIRASGGSDVIGQGELKFEKLQISSSGGSDLRLGLQANEVSVNSSGGSDVVLSGYTGYFKASASGGSNIKAQELESEEAEVSSSGAADVHIRVNRALTANASGGSDIFYYGNPEKLNTRNSGGSDITRRQ